VSREAILAFILLSKRDLRASIRLSKVRSIKYVGVNLFTILYFGLLSRLDFIVHGDLYNYGLQFSLEWAGNYWVTYSAAYLYFAIVMGSVYWLASKRRREDLKTSLGLSMTVIFLQLGGLQDIFFFCLWGGGLPPNGVIWWWMPWYQILGVWNTSMQVSLMAGMTLIAVIMWGAILYSSFFSEKLFALFRGWKLDRKSVRKIMRLRK
jgi:hypothetical protein